MESSQQWANIVGFQILKYVLFVTHCVRSKDKTLLLGSSQSCRRSRGDKIKQQQQQTLEYQCGKCYKRVVPPWVLDRRRNLTQVGGVEGWLMGRLPKDVIPELNLEG